MRRYLTLTSALLLALPTIALAQGHEHGGGGDHGGGGGHPGGGGGHPGGGGGGPHMGGSGPHPGGGGGHEGGRAAGGAGRPNGFAGRAPNVVVNDRENNRVVVNNGVRGDRGSGFHGGANTGPRGGHGLPPGPSNGGWHRGWYGGHVSGFRPMRAAPFRYPRGYSYRRWGIGLVLPSILFGSAYYYSSWNNLGAYPPPPGDRWVRYGPDLLLVNIRSGRVDDAIYGAFY